MALSVAYVDKYRLWADIVRANQDRMFVPTQADVPLGSSTLLQAALPNSSMPVVLRGTVVARRAESLRFRRGVYLHIDDKEMDKCRRILGLTHAPARGFGRRDLRHPCSLPARLEVDGRTTAGLEVKNLSVSGALLSCPVALAAGGVVELVMTLDDAEDLRVAATVTWVGATEPLAGLRFENLDGAAVAALARCTERLARYSTRRMATRRVVVADDDPGILHLLATVLSRHGYEVYRAADGAEAAGLIRELHPALVLLDILMPGVDGVDICKQMRSDHELADVPVVFTSALEPATLQTLAEESGATDFLPKPLGMADLINLVGHYLRIGHGASAQDSPTA